MKTVYARREFIKQASRHFAFLGLGSVVFDSVLGKFLQQAVAQTIFPNINPSGYYIHYTFSGGAPRWFFDLPLTPFGKTSSNFVDGGFGTVIRKTGGSYQPAYAVQKHTVGGKDLYLPPVWNMDLKSQDFSSILSHAAFIRGLDMEINNHRLSN
jgi:hypothetical protein